MSVSCVNQGITRPQKKTGKPLRTNPYSLLTAYVLQHLEHTDVDVLLSVVFDNFAS
jgi:hypothetical protein